ncbi:hypothetical protein DRF60_02100 [Chryseobacterium elymi]|uniref:Uncharacterized protein n=1 Tax=Chryseobacterium elymi TaxID=395936 RepID=A0A3D9DR50_9FLAO|nr:hypothetical protein DRF60_02100 [Chryseobacterium elymi]
MVLGYLERLSGDLSAGSPNGYLVRERENREQDNLAEKIENHSFIDYSFYAVILFGRSFRIINIDGITNHWFFHFLSYCRRISG